MGNQVGQSQIKQLIANLTAQARRQVGSPADSPVVHVVKFAGGLDGRCRHIKALQRALADPRCSFPIPSDYDPCTPTSALVEAAQRVDFVNNLNQAIEADSYPDDSGISYYRGIQHHGAMARVLQNNPLAILDVGAEESPEFDHCLREAEDLDNVTSSKGAEVFHPVNDYYKPLIDRLKRKGFSCKSDFDFIGGSLVASSEAQARIQAMRGLKEAMLDLIQDAKENAEEGRSTEHVKAKLTAYGEIFKIFLRDFVEFTQHTQDSACESLQKILRTTSSTRDTVYWESPSIPLKEGISMAPRLMKQGVPAVTVLMQPIKLDSRFQQRQLEDKLADDRADLADLQEIFAGNVPEDLLDIFDPERFDALLGQLSFNRAMLLYPSFVALDNIITADTFGHTLDQEFCEQAKEQHLPGEAGEVGPVGVVTLESADQRRPRLQGQRARHGLQRLED